MKNNQPFVVIVVGVLLVVGGGVLLYYGQTAGFWVLLVFGALLVAGGVLERKGIPVEPNESGKELAEYRRKRTLLSPPEREFFRLLNALLNPEAFLVLPQMALVAVIDKLTQNSYRNELFRIADFCVADAVTTEPLLLIELNDASHNRPDRAERDRKVADICARAGLPLVAFTLEEACDEKNVRRVLRKHL